jgi:hypothetical protein
MVSHEDDSLEDEGDVLGTPGAENKRWGETTTPETPSTAANRAKRTKGNTTGGGVTLTLRDQEKVRNCISPQKNNLFNHT